jgi:hypothetical protein
MTEQPGLKPILTHVSLSVEHLLDVKVRTTDDPTDTTG